MRAAVVPALGKPLEIREVPVPQPGPGQVLVKIEASGLCHTDIHAARGDWPVAPKIPLVPGHEGVGTIAAVGDGVDPGTIGDRVALPWLGHACGRCRSCVSGWETYCTAPAYTGYTIDGSYADYAIGYASHAVPVPAGVSSVDAAPLTCAGVTTYKALKVALSQPNETAMIVGIGGLGTWLCSTPGACPTRASPATPDAGTSSSWGATRPTPYPACSPPPWRPPCWNGPAPPWPSFPSRPRRPEAPAAGTGCATMLDVPAIELRDVVKTFGRVRALDGLDLAVEQGEVHGFLGPNGAGKSTTIRVLLGLLKADGGSATMLGSDPWRDAAELHRRLAYVPGDVALWPNLTGGEVIDVLGRMRGGLDESRRAEMLDRFELDPRKKARTYSKGNRQKVALVAALSARADLYLLDEPTSGLDPLMEAEFQRAVLELRSDGATVLLSSHILAEAEALADRVSIIRAGKVVQTGSLAELRHLTRTTVIADTERPAVDIGQVEGVHHPELRDGRVTFDVDSDHLDAAVRVLASFGIRSLAAHPPTLEELFLRQYGEDVTA